MRRRAVSILGPVLLAVALWGCGEKTEPDAEPVDSSASELTVAEFIAELAPEKERILSQLVPEIEACDGIAVDRGFALVVTDAAIDAAPDSPLADVVERQC